MKPEHKIIFESLTDAQLMGLCIERESGGEPTEGKIAVGTVILERVDHRNWDGKTIKEVILKPWQFSWTMIEAGKDYYIESIDIASNFVNECKLRPSLGVCYNIASAMIEGKLPRDPDLAKVHCCEYVERRFRRYMDTHPEKKGNRWWQKMKLYKTIAHHEFYISI